MLAYCFFTPLFSFPWIVKTEILLRNAIEKLQKDDAEEVSRSGFSGRTAPVPGWQIIVLLFLGSVSSSHIKIGWKTKSLRHKSHLLQLCARSMSSWRGMVEWLGHSEGGLPKGRKVICSVRTPISNGFPFQCSPFGTNLNLQTRSIQIKIGIEFLKDCTSW